MAARSFHPPQRTLMGPGPSDVYPRVLEAMSRPTVGHLDPSFVTMMDEVKALLRYAFQTDYSLAMPISHQDRPEWRLLLSTCWNRGTRW